MKNKKILIAIGAVALLAILALVVMNRPSPQELESEIDTQQDVLIDDEDAVEGAAVLEFSIDRPEDEVEGLEDEALPPATDTAADQQVLGEAEARQTVYTFFYGDTCPYCHDVTDWFDETGIESQLNIVRKEVYNDPANSQQLSLAAQTCGESGGGVPFLFTPDKQCIVGSTPIIDYLSGVAGI